MKKQTQSWKMIKIADSVAEELEDEVAIEYPLTVVVNGEEFATMVCTPENMDFLVVGFLASEGVIRLKTDIRQISVDEDKGFAYVELNKEWTMDESYEKRWIGSCCGKSRAFYFQNDAKTARTIMSHFTIRPLDCLNLMKAFHKSAELFQRTGGVHQASIATKDQLRVTFTDIGRHNALDKLFGYMILNGIQSKDHLILFSGRISSEVLLKVSKMGIGCLLSKSAPTNLALQLAEDLNITAIGFVRGGRMNVYTHPSRLEQINDHSTFASAKEGGIEFD